MFSSSFSLFQFIPHINSSIAKAWLLFSFIVFIYQYTCKHMTHSDVVHTRPLQYPKFPSIHSSEARSWRQQFQQGAPDFPFPGHIILLWLGDSKSFPGQCGDIICVPIPGPHPLQGILLDWLCHSGATKAVPFHQVLQMRRTNPQLWRIQLVDLTGGSFKAQHFPRFIVHHQWSFKCRY